MGLSVCIATMEDSMEVFQNIKTETPSYSAVPFLGTYPKEMKSVSKDTYALMSMVTTLTITKSLKLLEYILTDK